MRADDDDASLDKVELVTRHVARTTPGDLPLEDVAALVGHAREHLLALLHARHRQRLQPLRQPGPRVAKACELLISGDEVPITDICFEVGFNNVANFNRRFRELKSVTPREYRKQARLRHVSRLARTD